MSLTQLNSTLELLQEIQYRITQKGNSKKIYFITLMTNGDVDILSENIVYFGLIIIDGILCCLGRRKQVFANFFLLLLISSFFLLSSFFDNFKLRKIRRRRPKEVSREN